MKLLLDTQARLWMIGPVHRLNADARALLSDSDNELYLSSASVWEVAIKEALGKLRFPASPAVYLPPAIRRSGVRQLAVTADHAIRVGELPMHHRDPFDRMLIAQAQTEELTIVTPDPNFGRYDVAVIGAQA